MLRLNKFLSICGVTSRRGAEQLISQKKVAVNDIVVDKMGVIIDEQKDRVKVDGVVVEPVKKRLYILLNKPKQVLTTLHDPFRRKTIAYFVKSAPARVYPVGRLDYDTEGALLLTNDGELAYRLAHPKYQVKRVYQAIVSGVVTADHIEALKRGIRLDDGHLGRIVEAEILMSELKSSKVQLVLMEGHKREVKQLLKGVGHPVKALKRVEFAGLRIDDLKPGRWRFLTHVEIRRLKDMVGVE